MSTFTTKVIEFHFLKEDPDASDEEVAAHKIKPILTNDIEFMQNSLDKIEANMILLESNCRHLRMREAQQREIIQSTSHRLKWVSILEALILLGMNVFQIIFVRRSLDLSSRKRY